MLISPTDPSDLPMELKRTERTGKELSGKVSKYAKGVETLLKGGADRDGEATTTTTMPDHLPSSVELTMDESVRKKLGGPLRDISAMLAKYAGSIALCRGKLDVLRGNVPSPDGAAGSHGSVGGDGDGDDGEPVMTEEDKKRKVAETQAGFAREIAATQEIGGIPPNSFAAAVDVRGTDYILVKVVQFMVVKKQYKVRDADVANNKVYPVPVSSIVRLGYQSFSPNTRVLAMFPETSTFYPATVIGKEAGSPSGKAYRLIFDDDEDEEGVTPQRVIDASFVTTFPASHPEAAQSTKQPHKKQRRR